MQICLCAFDLFVHFIFVWNWKHNSFVVGLLFFASLFVYFPLATLSPSLQYKNVCCNRFLWLQSNSCKTIKHFGPRSEWKIDTHKKNGTKTIPISAEEMNNKNKWNESMKKKFRRTKRNAHDENVILMENGGKHRETGREWMVTDVLNSCSQLFQLGNESFDNNSKCAHTKKARWGGTNIVPKRNIQMKHSQRFERKKSKRFSPMAIKCFGE